MQPVAGHITLCHDSAVGHLLACERQTREAVGPEFVEECLIVGMSRGRADKTNGEPRRDRDSGQKLFSHVAASCSSVVAGGNATCACHVLSIA
jgi:hypothetical protein